MQYYKVVYAYNQDGTEKKAERKVVGGLSLAYTLALVRDVCYAFHRAECQIQAVYIGENDDWTEVQDWADQERAQLDAIAKQAEKEEKMSDLDKKQLDRLYNLLHEKEQSDPDVAAVLRWAIFQLEQKGSEKQTGDLVFRLAFTPEPEINEIMDSGAFNEIVKGYVVVAMQGAKIERDEILDAIDALEDAFDDTDAAAARSAYKEII